MCAGGHESERDPEKSSATSLAYARLVALVAKTWQSAVVFTGTMIKALREALGFTVDHFAGLMGVHPATLYRWEAKGDEPARLDPMQLRILIALQDELKKKASAKAQAEWGAALLSALIIGGGLFALYKVLESVFDEQELRRAPASSRPTSSRLRQARGGARPRG